MDHEHGSGLQIVVTKSEQRTQLHPQGASTSAGFSGTPFASGEFVAKGALSLPAKLEEEQLSSVFESYVRYYAAGDGHTARAKRYDLEHFLKFLSAGRSPLEVRVNDWTLQSTKDFIESRLQIGEAPSTVARRLATLKHVGRTLAERVAGYINPAREAKAPVFHPSRPQGLTAEEIGLLRSAAEHLHEGSKDPFASARNRTLVEILLSTGLRADEIRLLTVQQISDDLSWLSNVRTKGKKFRNVYLDSSVRDTLRDYLELREQVLLERNADYAALTAAQRGRFPVFISLYRVSLDDPMSYGLSPKTVWRIVYDIGLRAQVLAARPMGNLHPHKLRHTFAHGLLDSSKDVRLVAQALGHSDVRTTMRYTERTDEHIAQAIEAQRDRERQSS